MAQILVKRIFVISNFSLLGAREKSKFKSTGFALWVETNDY